MEIIDCNKAELILYQIKHGNTLESIASIFDVQINSIVRNNYNVDLYEGEVVKVVRQTQTYHIVKPMETLSSISSMYSVDMDTIIRINSLSSKRLFVGQKLVIFSK